MEEILKTRQISDAHIQFVSLVDKAANKKSFLVTKAEDGKANFSAYGKIVKTDPDTHYVTGVVYEPLVKDSQGDCMTADEIRKAAYWFAKNGSGIDIQHNFEKFEKAEVVESWIAPSNFEIGKEKIKKGSWLMTVEISDPDVWSAVEKGEITGFSMGGRGVYTESETFTKSESKSFLKKLAKALGLDIVEKGEFADEFNNRNKSTSFWDAFYSLQEILLKYNCRTDKNEPETDPRKIKECLAEFSAVIQDVLANDKTAIEKSLSSQNIEKLRSTYKNIGCFLSKAGESEENMTKSEITEFIKATIKESLNSEKEKNAEEPVKKALDEEIKKFIVDTIKELIPASEDSASEKEENITKEDVSQMVQKALEPLLQARGIPTNLSDEPETIEKNESIFDGAFI